MGWKGAVRSFIRLNKELNKAARTQESLQAVQAYEAQIERLLRAHLSCSARTQWQLNSLEAIDNLLPALLSKVFGLKEKVALTRKVLDGELEGYQKAWEGHKSLKELKDIGASSVDIQSATQKQCVMEVKIASCKDVVPREKYTCLKSGKLSVKPMSKTDYNELFQAHACSIMIRLAREAFALLPIELVVVTAVSSFLNEANGHNEDWAFISVIFPRDEFTAINFRNIDPASCVKSFAHRMDFRKTKGFREIEPVTFSEYELGTVKSMSRKLDELAQTAEHLENRVNELLEEFEGSIEPE